MNKLFTSIAVAGLMLGLVVSSFAQSIFVSTPSLVSRDGTVRGGAADQLFDVMTQTGTSQYVITDDVDWLSVSPASGSVATGNIDFITVSFVTTNLSPSVTYEGAITVVQTNGTPNTKTVAVTIQVGVDVTRGTILGNAIATVSNSIAIGDKGGLASAVAANAYQLGPGRNTTANTFKVGSNTVIGANGQIAAGVLDEGAINTNAPANSIAETKLARDAWGRYDTNATTVATQYTPRHILDLLGGREGSSNRLWYSSSATDSNSWIKLPL